MWFITPVIGFDFVFPTFSLCSISQSVPLKTCAKNDKTKMKGLSGDGLHAKCKLKVYFVNFIKEIRMPRCSIQALTRCFHFPFCPSELIR